jgi:hypothetical protein
MWDLCPLEVLKLVASIASILTPVLIFLLGFCINRTIQRQNAVIQRRSSWLTKWADDFYQAAAMFNDSATSFLFLYYEASWQELGGGSGAAVNISEPSVDTNRSESLLVELNRRYHEMHHFMVFAKDKGESIKSAASDLLTEACKWHFKKEEPDENAFRSKQLAFNQCVKSLYSELIEDKNLK